MIPACSGTTAREPSQPSGSGARRAWRAFGLGTVVTFALMAVWAITMPLYSGPDEPSQAAHAAALVRGQLFGTPVRNFRFPGADVTVPGTLGNGTDDISCYWYHPAIPASCAAGVRLTSRPVAALTYSSRYPPLYYTATGLVTLVDQSSSTLIYMRLVGALMCSVLLGLAYMALAVWSANRVLPVGFLCALTPMAVYLGGVLNPSGLEIAAAICLWASGVVLMLEHAEDPPPGLVLVVAASAVVLTCTRGLSPLFALLSIVALAALVGQQTVARLFRSRRDVRWGALALIVVAVVTVAWVLYAHSLSLLPAGSRVSPSASDLSIVGQAFGQTRIWLEQMVGVLGWGDASMPSWTYRVWGLVLVLLVLLALRSRHRQGLLVLGWLIGLSLLLPVAISLVDTAEHRNRLDRPLHAAARRRGARAGGRARRCRRRRAAGVAAAHAAAGPGGGQPARLPGNPPTLRRRYPRALRLPRGPLATHRGMAARAHLVRGRLGPPCHTAVAPDRFADAPAVGDRDAVGIGASGDRHRAPA